MTSSEVGGARISIQRGSLTFHQPARQVDFPSLRTMLSSRESVMSIAMAASFPSSGRLWGFGPFGPCVDCPARRKKAPIGRLRPHPHLGVWSRGGW